MPSQPDLFASGAYVRASQAPAPAQVTVNTDDWTLRELSRAREANFSGLFGALDAKRPRAWDQYGYPEEVTFAAMLQAYERGGPGHGAVHKLLDKCWQDVPRIKQPKADKETEWEARQRKTLEAVGAWRKLRDLDRRNMIGRYAALIYRVGDGRDLNQPLGNGKLVDLVPVFEDQIRVTEWDSDQNSNDYGKPRMFQFQARSPSAKGDMQGKPAEWADVHPSRVQMFAEGSVGDFMDGVPLLRAGFNSLIDIEKISGGSAEGYLKNSARTVVVKFDPNASVSQLASKPGQAAPADVNEALNDKVKDLNRNIDAALMLKGGEASTLQTQQHDPGPPFEVAGNIFAASVRIPFTILFGQQTGRLASDEDNADFNARGKSRRDNELTPMVREFITRMQGCGALEAGDFEVEWLPLDAPGDKDKVEVLLKMAQAMESASGAGLTEPLYDANELRKVTGHEQRTDDGMPEEGDLTPEERAAQEAAGQRGQRPALRQAA